MSETQTKKKTDKLAAFKIGFGLAFALQPFEVLRTKLVIENDINSVFRAKNGFLQTWDTIKSI